MPGARRVRRAGRARARRTTPSEYLRCAAPTRWSSARGRLTLEELLAARAGARPRPTCRASRAWLPRPPAAPSAHAAPRRLLRTSTRQPWPDREAIDLDRYVRDVARAPRPRLGVADHRARLSLHLHLVLARGLRPHPPPALAGGRGGRGGADRRAYAPDMLWYADDVFTIHRHVALALRRRARAGAGIRIPFECISRGDRLDSRSPTRSAAMGCFRLWVGAESGSQRVLDAMERRTTVEAVQVVPPCCRRAGIEAGMFIMLGYEGEEVADLEATVAHLKRGEPGPLPDHGRLPDPRHRVLRAGARTACAATGPGTSAPTATCASPAATPAATTSHATRWMVNEVRLRLARRRGSRDWLRLGRMLLSGGAGRLGMWRIRGEREEEGLEVAAGGLGARLTGGRRPGRGRMRLVLYNPRSSAGRKPVLPMSLLAVGAVLEGRRGLPDRRRQPRPRAARDPRPAGRRSAGASACSGSRSCPGRSSKRRCRCAGSSSAATPP